MNTHLPDDDESLAELLAETPEKLRDRFVNAMADVAVEDWRIDVVLKLGDGVDQFLNAGEFVAAKILISHAENLAEEWRHA